MAKTPDSCKPIYTQSLLREVFVLYVFLFFSVFQNLLGHTRAVRLQLVDH